MTDKVTQTIKKHNMLEPGDTVGVGVSGGADSVALLHFLVNNKDLLGFESVTAVHVNHLIRGEEAERDADFTKEVCKNLGVPCKVVTVDVPGESEKTGESIETCARRLRYEIFESFGFRKFATAHNLNDRMETFFFNLARGASISGLLSIPYVRNSYIRPLLDVTREEIEKYLQENGLTHITDSTNSCDDYTRNKIRHNLIPQMFELNPSFDKAFLKCEESLEITNGYLKREAESLVKTCRDGYTFQCEKLKQADSALRLTAISQILKEQNVKNIIRDYVYALEHIILFGGSANLCECTAHCERDVLHFGEAEEIPDFSVKIDIASKFAETPCGNFKVYNLLKKDLQNFNKQHFNNCIDCDRIKGQLKVRSRIPGESIKLHGRGITKTLKQLFNEKKIPVSKRQKIAVLADDEGIVWLEGFGVCERCAVTERTVNAIMFLRMEDKND